MLVLHLLCQLLSILGLSMDLTSSRESAWTCRLVALLPRAPAAPSSPHTAMRLPEVLATWWGR